MSEKKVSRRKYLKYAAAGAAGVAVAGGALYYFLGTKPGGEKEEEAINIAAFHPVSGPGAALGREWWRAELLAIKDINKKGIKGFSKINVYFNDTETSSAATKKKWERVTQTEQIDAVLFGGLESIDKTVVRAAGEAGYPHITGAETGLFKFFDIPLNRYRFAHDVCNIDQGLAAGETLDRLGAKKVAYIGADYDYGYSIYAGLNAYNDKNGNPFEIDPVLFTPLDKTDYSSEITLIKNANVDALVPSYTGAGFLSLPKQLVTANAKPEILFYSGDWGSLGEAQFCGYEGMKNAYVRTPRDVTTDDWKKFVEKWRTEYGEESYPMLYTSGHYQVVWALKTAFEKAGTKDKEIVTEALRNTEWCGEEGAVRPAASCTGPFSEYGRNLSLTSTIIQYREGASEFMPDFNLHPEIVGYYTSKYSLPEAKDLLAKYRP